MGADAVGCTAPSAASYKVVTLNRGTERAAGGNNILNCYSKGYHLAKPFVMKRHKLN